MSRVNMPIVEIRKYLGSTQGSTRTYFFGASTTPDIRYSMSKI